MRRLLLFLISLLVFAVFSSPGAAADAPAAESSKTTTEKAAVTAAAAAAATKAVEADAGKPHFIEHLVDVILELFDVRAPENENTAIHYVISGCLLVAALILRRVVTLVLFSLFRRFASHTRTTLDDKLFAALEAPVGALVMLTGIFAALQVLKLSDTADELIGNASTVAFSLAFFWLLLRALSTVLDHAQEVAKKREKGIAAFMPWIKKTVLTVFVVLGVLMVFQSLGFNVRAILAGLGLGGLAFALAAQDTLANVFGSVVVAVDQPFRLGEFVQIGSNMGGVEDIGLRSTRLRRIDKSLIVIPNKIVAAEPIVNLSRFTRRRAEQVMGLTYDTKPEQMEEVVAEFRRLLTSDPEIDPKSVMVYFRDLNASSLDIWLVYETPDPDFNKHMTVRQRMNVAMMNAVYARGLSFAFPTKTVHFAGEIAETLAARGAKPASEGGENERGNRVT